MPHHANADLDEECIIPPIPDAGAHYCTDLGCRDAYGTDLGRERITASILEVEYSIASILDAGVQHGFALG